MAGATGTIVTGSPCDATPLLLTTTVAVPELPAEGRTSHGICAFTCPEDTKYNPAGMLLILTETLLSVVDRGTVSFCVSPDARPDPKMDTREPGATACPLVKLAPFNTPPGVIAGWACR